MSTSPGNLRTVRFFRTALTWLLAAAFGFGVYRVYRWAEPSPASIAAVLSPTTASNVSLELEDAYFENFADGSRNWSLHAGRIALERQNGGVPNSLQAALIDDIRDGKLFAGPLENRGQGSGVRGQEGHRDEVAFHLQPSSLSNVPLNPPPGRPPAGRDTTLNQSGTDNDPSPPSATFTAQHGKYLVGSTEGLPAEMQFTFAVQWQFQLTGNVKIRTREGHQFHAPAIVVLELYNRKTGKTERHIMCNQGGEIRAKGATVQANQARYDDKNQTVECLGGVHAQMQQDSVQAETFHWSLKTEMILCPEQASGTWRHTPFTARNLSIDLKHHRYRGSEMNLQLSQDQALNNSLP